MLEILIRENGGEPKWVAAHKVLASIVKRKPKSDSPSPPALVSEEFKQWYLSYGKKATKKEANNYWNKNITFDMIETIMKHTKLYVKSTEKLYRLDPIRYLKREKWNDEIIEQEIKIDLDEHYPFDKSGASRLGRCSMCNSIVFGNKFTIGKDDSSCCKSKINKYKG